MTLAQTILQGLSIGQRSATASFNTAGRLQAFAAQQQQKRDEDAQEHAARDAYIGELSGGLAGQQHLDPETGQIDPARLKHWNDLPTADLAGQAKAQRKHAFDQERKAEEQQELDEELTKEKVKIGLLEREGIITPEQAKVMRREIREHRYENKFGGSFDFEPDRQGDTPPWLHRQAFTGLQSDLRSLYEQLNTPGLLTTEDDKFRIQAQIDEKEQQLGQLEQLMGGLPQAPTAEPISSAVGHPALDPSKTQAPTPNTQPQFRPPTLKSKGPPRLTLETEEGGSVDDLPSAGGGDPHAQDPVSGAKSPGLMQRFARATVGGVPGQQPTITIDGQQHEVPQFNDINEAAAWLLEHMRPDASEQEQRQLLEQLLAIGGG